MSNAPGEYLYFYLIGRRDEEPAISIDLPSLAERVVRGELMRTVTADAAERAMKAAELDGFERTWININKAEITEAGGDQDKAYEFYRRGVTDELASSMEEDVLDHVADLLDATFGGADDAPVEDDEEDEDDDDDDDAKAH